MVRSFALTPFEEMLKAWYTEHRALMPWDLFLLKEKEIREKNDITADPYHVIDPCCWNYTNAIYDKNLGFVDYNNMQLLVSGQYCMMTRQPRYFPAIPFDNASALIFFSWSGTGTIILSDDSGTESIPLQEGDFLFAAGHQRKTILCNSDDSIIFYFSLSSDLLSLAPVEGLPSILLSSGSHASNSACNRILFYKTGADPRIRTWIGDMLRESVDQRPNYHQFLFHTLSLLVIYLQREYDNLYLPSRTQRSSYVPDFQKYLRDHYTGFSLREMAAHFHISASYICRIYKQCTGTTLLRSLQEIRIQIAKYLLENTYDPIEDIAMHTGYQDTSYFIEIFRKATGRTPYQYRLSLNAS